MGAAMLPGLGLVRRAVTLGLCTASFWAGVQVERARHPQARPAAAACAEGIGSAGCERGTTP